MNIQILFSYTVYGNFMCHLHTYRLCLCVLFHSGCVSVYVTLLGFFYYVATNMIDSK